MDLKKIICSFIGFSLAIPAVANEEVVVQSQRCSSNATYPVHLTFDDGPKIPETIRVLDTLKKHGIKATFFISTSRFKNMASGKPPTANERRLLSVLERMKAEGHTIGSHSFEHLDHANLQSSRREQIMQNLQMNDRVMKSLNLEGPIPFRFPYGSGWIRDNNSANQSMASLVTREIKSQGYYPMHWDIDTWDWSKIKRQALPQSVLQQICSHGGGVALMHDIHAWTANNLEPIILSIKESGHRFVSEAEIQKYSPRNSKGPLVSYQDSAAGLRSCGHPVSDLDQVWSSCSDYEQRSSDRQGGVR